MRQDSVDYEIVCTLYVSALGVRRERTLYKMRHERFLTQLEGLHKSHAKGRSNFTDSTLDSFMYQRVSTRIHQMA